MARSFVLVLAITQSLERGPSTKGRSADIEQELFLFREDHTPYFSNHNFAEKFPKSSSDVGSTEHRLWTGNIRLTAQQTH